MHKILVLFVLMAHLNPLTRASLVVNPITVNILEDFENASSRLNP